MKVRIKLILSLLSLLVFSAPRAAFLEVTGQVQKLPIAASATGTNIDWVLLSGVTSAGACPVYGAGPIFYFTDDAAGDRIYAYLLTAQTTGATVTIGVNDAQLNSLGYCTIMYVYH